MLGLRYSRRISPEGVFREGDNRQEVDANSGGHLKRIPCRHWQAAAGVVDGFHVHIPAALPRPWLPAPCFGGRPERAYRRILVVIKLGREIQRNAPGKVLLGGISSQCEKCPCWKRSRVPQPYSGGKRMGRGWGGAVGGEGKLRP